MLKNILDYNICQYTGTPSIVHTLHQLVSKLEIFAEFREVFIKLAADVANQQEVLAPRTPDAVHFLFLYIFPDLLDFQPFSGSLNIINIFQ